MTLAERILAGLWILALAVVTVLAVNAMRREPTEFERRMSESEDRLLRLLALEELWELESRDPPQVRRMRGEA